MLAQDKLASGKKFYATCTGRCIFEEAITNKVIGQSENVITEVKTFPSELDVRFSKDFSDFPH